MTDLLAEVLAAFVSDEQVALIEDLSHEEALYRKGTAMGNAFTGAVHALRTVIPSGAVRELAADIWDVVGKKYVPTALGPAVPTLSFVAMPSNEGIQAMILFPHNWLNQVADNPLYQLGAVIMVGSQAVDFYNGRFDIEAPSVIQQRAFAFEAALMHVLDLKDPNKYQRNTMAAYPRGVPPEMLYDRKPVLDPS